VLDTEKLSCVGMHTLFGLHDHHITFSIEQKTFFHRLTFVNQSTEYPAAVNN